MNVLFLKMLLLLGIYKAKLHRNRTRLHGAHSELDELGRDLEIATKKHDLHDRVGRGIGHRGHGITRHKGGEKEVMNYDSLASGKVALEEARQDSRHRMKNAVHPGRRGGMHAVGRGSRRHSPLKKTAAVHAKRRAMKAARNRRRRRNLLDRAERRAELAAAKAVGAAKGAKALGRARRHAMDAMDEEHKRRDRRNKVREIGRATEAQMAMEELKNIGDDDLKEAIAKQELAAAAMAGIEPVLDEELTVALANKKMRDEDAARLIDDDLKTKLLANLRPEEVERAMGRAAKSEELKEAAHRLARGSPPVAKPTPTEHQAAVQAAGDTRADQVDVAMARRGVPATARKAIAAEEGEMAALKANDRILESEVNGARDLVERSALANQRKHDILREREAKNLAEAEKLAALRNGLPADVAEDLARTAYDESMARTAAVTGPDPRDVEEAADIAGNAVNNHQIAKGVPPHIAGEEASAVAGHVASAVPPPPLPPLPATLEEAAAAHGFVPAEKLASERIDRMKAEEVAAAAIGKLSEDNAEQRAENVVLREGLGAIPKSLILGGPEGKQFEQAAAIKNTKMILSVPENMREDAIGVIKAIPSEARNILVERGTIYFPLKTPKDYVPETEEEQTYMDELRKLEDRIGGTVTPTKYETGLNTIAGEGGVINLPPGSEKLLVEEGKVFFDRPAVEGSSGFQGRENVKQIINRGENPNVPVGEAYYEAEVAGASLPIPTAESSQATTVMMTRDGPLDISGASHMFIEKGEVMKIPTSEFVRHQRPVVNEDVEAVKVATPEEQRMLEETMKTIETLGRGSTTIRPSIDGGHVVNFKPVVGPAGEFRLEEAFSSLDSGKPAVLSEQMGQEGMEAFGALGGGGEAEEELTLNVLNKARPGAKGGEEELVKAELRKAGEMSVHALTVENAFSQKPGKMMGEIVEEVGFRSAPQVTESGGFVFTETAEGFTVEPKAKREEVTEEGGVRMVEHKVTHIEILTGVVKAGLLNEKRKLAPLLGLTEKAFIEMIIGLPNSVIQNLIENAKDKVRNPITQETINYLEVFGGKKNLTQFINQIFTVVTKVTGRPNPRRKVVRNNGVRRSFITYGQPTQDRVLVPGKRQAGLPAPSVSVVSYSRPVGKQSGRVRRGAHVVKVGSNLPPKGKTSYTVTRSRQSVPQNPGNSQRYYYYYSPPQQQVTQNSMKVRK